MQGILEAEVSKDLVVNLIHMTKLLMIPVVLWTNLVTDMLIN